ncbi:PAS domain-containing sensor histidine kinase [Mariprofundus sp. EBB-1]|uniref:PAS domain-containing hybrid sensor histidine kinase/response regulator n=1 Tax=Mariprofundus sp. EBB-1 TaxID=2650971 RepID=UPI000EF1D0ED|nr:PAS domain-containing sensor histidine kinase [Mariprofundus sp. EBB-1]RLL55592.1 PAS domain-containing sensor histidine kinase [Mariprofundus sp. EBB-1]
MKENEIKYNKLLNAMHEVYYSTDLSGNIVEISPSIKTVAGYTCSEMTGMPATFFYKHPEDRSQFIELLTSQSVVTDYALELLHKDGHTIHVLANAHTILNHQQVCIGIEGLLRDVTEQVELKKQIAQLNIDIESRVEQRTAELEEKNLRLQTLSQAIEQSGEGFIITDRAGCVTYVNKAFEQINGYSSDEVLGKSLSILDSGKHNADFFHNIWHTIRSGKVWEGNIINRRKNGTEYPALMTIVPIMLHDEIKFYSAIQQDMSEYETLEAQFQQAQKMDAIGTLVGGISHDFNNMLAGLLMHLYLAKRNITNPEKSLDSINKAEKLGYQASEIIKDLLIFSRNDDSEMQSLVFNKVLSDSIGLLKISIPEQIQLKLNICTQNISIMGDITQLQQVLMNLLNNARDALKSRPAGQIEVSLEHFIINQAFADQHPGIHEDAMLKLSISDNGCGIPNTTINKVFDPFFTTKDAGHGTGLGLSMAYGCIHKHQGIIEVESQVDIGTTFHIYLPLIKDQFAEEDEASQGESYQGHGELILVADDNKVIQKLIVEALKALNYQTLQAADGNEALRLFKAHQSDIKLAILDMVMPCMSGQEAARRMRISAPKLPFIFSTGHDPEDAKHEVSDFDYSSLYQKPFKLTQLSQEIQRLLNA